MTFNIQIRTSRKLKRADSDLAVASARRGRRRPKASVGDGEEDRISSLPDDLLIAVLASLCDVEEAARTSVLARRWRGLWTQLPRLSFDCVRLDALEASLAQVTRPALDFLAIDLILDGEADGRVSSLLHDIAERLAPKKLAITFDDHVQGYEDVTLPCFRTTTYLDLCPNDVCFALPPAGSKFEALTTLILDTFTIDLGNLLPMCPSLLYLDLTDFFGDETLAVYSPSLEKLSVVVREGFTSYSCIDISAPLLKEASFNMELVPELFSISAPMLKQIYCRFTYEEENVGFQCMRLSSLNYSLRRGVHRLCLDMVYFIEMRCPLSRPCEEPDNNWRNLNISLTDLEVVTLDGFNGHDDEVDFLNVLFRCVTGFQAYDCEGV
ncbi:unnamed protein product [Urochloa decumbens]|uniref:F-box domain-containing protein n=1 Tax=Urochloa decumbens TaxID=240449 RepID=A0ABC8VL87_9POAL